MKEESGILLNTHFMNFLKIGGELAWYSGEINASTGYHWQVVPDNSGVYEQVGTITLAPSVPQAVGVPGMVIWQFKAVRAGKGSIAFERYAPGGTSPAERIIAQVEVV